MSNDFMSEEDKALFRLAVANVKPLTHSNKILPLPASTSFQKKHTKKAFLPLRDKSEAFFLSDSYLINVEASTILSYCRHSIPVKRFRQLKNGQIPFEGKLDLHGLRIEKAKDALISFIVSKSEKGTRNLLIIHGKGGLRGESPVLKNLVNHWLPQFPQVLAFHSALPRDGGEGAVYVLLKKNKSSF